MDATTQLAEFIADTALEQIPASAVTAARRILVDSVGCALGGYAVEAGRRYATAMGNLGAGDGAVIIGDGRRTGAPWAACANTKLANLMDMDDVLWNIGHPGVTAAQSALAAAQAAGAGGQTLLRGIVLGYEVGARVTVACGGLANFIDGRVEYNSATPYGFGQEILGGAAAAAAVLGLDTSRVRAALCIARNYTPAPLNLTFRDDWTEAKYQLEWAAAGGTLGAFLAREGVGGPSTAVDPQYARAMGKLSYDERQATEGLGSVWRIEQASFKPYPCCRQFQGALGLFERIRREEGVGFDEIRAVRVRATSPSLLATWPWNNPAPADGYWGQFSLPFTMALVALDVPSGPDWLDPKWLNDPRVRAFAGRVTSAVDLERPAGAADRIPDVLLQRRFQVELDTERGTFVRGADLMPGDPWPETALSDGDLSEKFRANAATCLPADQAERLLDHLWRVDQLPDLAPLAPLLATRAAIGAGR